MRKPFLQLAIAGFCLAMIFGGVFGKRLLALTDEAREALRLYTELVSEAHDRYGVEVSYQELVEASIDGMLRTLDPHTNFLNREAYNSMRESQESSFSGLGILVGMRNGRLTVITPIEGTPASRLGLRAGDHISAIEGESTEALSLDQAVLRLKGPKGTQVTITVIRPGLQEPLQLTITRDEIPQDTVRYAYMITAETGYISLTDFNRGTGREMSEAIQELKEAGMQQLLVDLRGNGGGLLDQAVEVADLFVPAGAKIVETRGRTRDSLQEYRATAKTEKLSLPVVALVGTGTASAAEILAGAIQDHDIGLIVGEPTWGKGLVQTVYTLSYGHGLALTTAKYYTPSGRLIQRDYTSWFDYTAHANGPSITNGVIDEPQDEEQLFHTDLGRKVYGGGGIAPDVVVEPLELAPIFQLLLSRAAFFDFAAEWSGENSVVDHDWTPPPALLDQFTVWLKEEELTSDEEIDEAFSSAEAREMALRYLHAEIFNGAFGLEERYKVLAPSDPQIQKALQLFGEAGDLLARSQGLSGGPEDSAVAMIGSHD